LQPSALAKRLYLVIFLVIIAVYVFGLGRLPLLGPDEPRYAQVAREMLVRGDAITPTLGGHTWFEKPALLYWMIIAAAKVFGMNEWSARLGPAVCGLLTIAAVWWVGRETERASGVEGFGLWSALVTASCLGLIVFSRAASFDVVITMTTTWSLAFFLMHELAGERRRRTWLLIGFYAFVGMSLLAKGLVGIVIPFGVAGSYYLLRRRWPERRVFVGLGWGLPLALAVAATWYGPVIAKHGWLFIDEFFVQHHFARFVSNKYKHPQPIWFFPAIMLLLALPWTPLLIAALIKARSWMWRGNDSLSVIRIFALAWLLLPIVFFSFSGSKLPGYILPSVPAAALLVADWIASRNGRPIPYFVIFAATFLSVLIALLWVAPKFAARESARDLLQLADARGYANVPVIAQRNDDRSPQFYAHDRVVYNDEGEVVPFDEVTVDKARALGGKLLVLIPVEYVDHFRNARGIEVIGDNGRTALLGWTPP
jgi:4-amino-4-deoxy-L-arabinose transferase-like glycosyltransferase